MNEEMDYDVSSLVKEIFTFNAHFGSNNQFSSGMCSLKGHSCSSWWTHEHTGSAKWTQSI